MLSLVMLNVRPAECRYAECRHAPKGGESVFLHARKIRWLGFKMKKTL